AIAERCDVHLRELDHQHVFDARSCASTRINLAMSLARHRHRQRAAFKRFCLDPLAADQYRHLDSVKIETKLRSARRNCGRIAANWETTRMPADNVDQKDGYGACAY